MSKDIEYTILAVDDAKDTLMLLEFDLVEEGFNVITVESGEDALGVLHDQHVDLVLLDMYMPGISGLITLEKIKSNENFADKPVIMLSASDDEDQIVAALELGADDYVTKPYIAKVLLARIRTSLRLKEKTNQLKKIARTDFLTRINNRRSFEELCQKAISQAARAEQKLSLAIFDIDYFKKINDTYGHDAGDKALVDFAQLMKNSFRGYDIIGRIGGEEFAVCMPNTSLSDAYNVCERCRTMVSDHSLFLQEANLDLSYTISIGLASGEDGSLSFENLMRIADAGLYKAKETGRNKTVTEQAMEQVIDSEFLPSMSDESDILTGQIENMSEIDNKYPGIDYTVGVNNVLGDEALFKEILSMFHQDHGEDQNKIAQAIRDGDDKTLKHLVHTLKGVSCSIGAMTLYEHTKKLDVAVNEGRSSEFQSLFEPITAELSVVLSGIIKLIE